MCADVPPHQPHTKSCVVCPLGVRTATQKTIFKLSAYALSQPPTTAWYGGIQVQGGNTT